MRKKILFVHTTGYWWDHRYYFKQMPALQKEFADVTYLIKEDETIKNIPFNLITVSNSTTKWARKTGGLNLFIKLFNSKQDAIQLCNLELLPVGIILAIFSRKMIFYDCREDHYHAMLYSKVWFPKWVRFCLGFGVKTLEFLASKTFTGFIDSDPAIYKFHTAMPSHKKMIFYNMALTKQFEEVAKREPKKFDFTVLGSMSVRTGVLDVVNAIGELNVEGVDVNLKLIGSPDIDAKLSSLFKESIKLHKIENKVSITGRVPYFNIPYELSDCKIGVIPLLDLPKFQNNIATKQFEYMASGMPIIATDLPPQQFFIKDHYNGLHYEPGNIGELKKRMKYFLDNPEKIEEMGNKAIGKTKSEWNAEMQQIKFVQFYKLRLNKKPYYEKQLPPFFHD